MGNKSLPKCSINTDVVYRVLNKRKMSINEFAKLVGVNRRTMHEYLKKGEIPDHRYLAFWTTLSCVAEGFKTNDFFTGSIIFRPTCSICGGVIKSVVNFIDETNIISAEICAGERSVSLTKEYEIVPNRCPYCSTIFESIKMPAKMPYDPNNFR